MRRLKARRRAARRGGARRARRAMARRRGGGAAAADATGPARAMWRRGEGGSGARHDEAERSRDVAAGEAARRVAGRCGPGGGAPDCAPPGSSGCVPLRGPAGSISPPRPDRRRARGSGAGLRRRAMNRRRTHLGPRLHHPCAAPAFTTMIERPAVRVHDGGGGRFAVGERAGLTQRDELQGRIHGPAHQLSERALVLAAFGHRREHVFARLWIRSDGKKPKVRDPDPGICGFRGVEPNRGSHAATRSCTGVITPGRATTRAAQSP